MRFVALAAAAVLLSACGGQELKPFKTVEVTPWLGQTVLGDPNAPVEIVEYASTTCSHCRTFPQGRIPEGEGRPTSTPARPSCATSFCPPPQRRSRVAGGAIARCAGKDKFFDTIADLFENQNKLADAGSPRKVAGPASPRSAPATALPSTRSTPASRTRPSCRPWTRNWTTCPHDHRHALLLRQRPEGGGADGRGYRRRGGCRRSRAASGPGSRANARAKPLNWLGFSQPLNPVDPPRSRP